jgi:hypothetical protein
VEGGLTEVRKRRALVLQEEYRETAVLDTNGKGEDDRKTGIGRGKGRTIPAWMTQGSLRKGARKSGERTKEASRHWGGVTGNGEQDNNRNITNGWGEKNQFDDHCENQSKLEEQTLFSTDANNPHNRWFRMLFKKTTGQNKCPLAVWEDAQKRGQQTNCGIGFVTLVKNGQQFRSIGTGRRKLSDFRRSTGNDGNALQTRTEKRVQTPEKMPCTLEEATNIESNTPAESGKNARKGNNKRKNTKGSPSEQLGGGRTVAGTSGEMYRHNKQVKNLTNPAYYRCTKKHI